MEASEEWSPYCSFLICIFLPLFQPMPLLLFPVSGLQQGSAAAATGPSFPSLSKSGTVLAGTSAAVTHCKCFAFLDVLQGFGSPLWLEALGKLKANWKRGSTAAKTLQGWGGKLLGKLKRFCTVRTPASQPLPGMGLLVTWSELGTVGAESGGCAAR